MEKNSFIIYHKYRDILKDLTNEQVGILFRSIFDYEIDKTLPNLEGELKMAFNFVKTDLDFNSNKYNNICERNRKNGKYGGRPKKDQDDEKPKKPSGLFGNPKNPEKPKKPDNEYEYDNENIKKKEIYKEKGEYGWVKLTDIQYEKLCKEYSKNYIDFVITKIDEYTQSNGNKNKYKDFNVVIRKAIRDKWSILNGYDNNSSTFNPNNRNGVIKQEGENVFKI